MTATVAPPQMPAAPISVTPLIASPYANRLSFFKLPDAAMRTYFGESGQPVSMCCSSDNFIRYGSNILQACPTIKKLSVWVNTLGEGEKVLQQECLRNIEHFIFEMGVTSYMLKLSQCPYLTQLKKLQIGLTGVPNIEHVKTLYQNSHITFPNLTSYGIQLLPTTNTYKEVLTYLYTDPAKMLSKLKALKISSGTTNQSWNDVFNVHSSRLTEVEYLSMNNGYQKSNVFDTGFTGCMRKLKGLYVRGTITPGGVFSQLIGHNQSTLKHVCLNNCVGEFEAFFNSKRISAIETICLAGYSVNDGVLIGIGKNVTIDSLKTLVLNGPITFKGIKTLVNGLGKMIKLTTLVIGANNMNDAFREQAQKIIDDRASTNLPALTHVDLLTTYQAQQFDMPAHDIPSDDITNGGQDSMWYKKVACNYF